MVERDILRFGKPLFSELGGSKEMAENTVVIIPDLPEGFNYEDFEVKFTPIGDVTILPIFPLDGRELKENDLEGAFLGGYLGLYTPQRAEDDQILIEISEGINTQNPKRTTILIQFQEGKWRQRSFQIPLEIHPSDEYSVN